MKTLRTFVVCNMVLLLLCTAIACHRSYYRRQADADAARLIQEKTLDPHWSLPGYTIEIDPASRMFDPFSQDHPPMPPDDPAAAEYMQCVDGKPGYPHWHANGDTPFVENPEWRYLLPVDEEGKLVIDLESAVELALLHSPDYQRQLENLYFAALDVSLERFDFESQFFFSDGYTSTATNLTATPLAGGSTFRKDTTATLRKAGITGSTLLVEFANNIVWQFSGNDITTNLGSLSAAFTQPLLRGAGRDVILASLTQSERNLLYAVRQLERFRRAFAQNIVIGSGTGNGVSFEGSQFAQVLGIITAARGGVLGLLQEQQRIRNLTSNIDSQRALLEQFNEYYNFQRIDLLQLKQFRNQVYRSQRDLLTQQVDYQTSLDDFKIRLGFPPDLDVEVKDPILNPFILIDDMIMDRRAEVSNIKIAASNIFLDITDYLGDPVARLKAARDAVLAAGRDPITDLSWTSEDIEFNKEISDKIRLVRSQLQKVDAIYDKIVEVDFPRTEQDIKKLEASIPRRRNSLDALQKRYFDTGNEDSQSPVIEPEVLNSSNLEQLVEQRIIEFNGGERLDEQGNPEIVLGARATVLQSKNRLRDLLRTWDLILANDGKVPDDALTQEPLKSMIAADPTLRDALKTRANTIRRLVSEPGPEVLTEITNLITDVSLIQALARVDTLTLPIVDIDWKSALEIARENRRDWMNARALLVDSWRLIEFTADNLESELNLTFNGELNGVGDQPFKIRRGNGRVQVGLQFDAPITRLAERNDYRETLIRYQRSKRDYYQFEDEISAQLRETIRQLELVKLNFEISRIQIKNAVDEVQLASYALIRPPRPGSGNNQLGTQVALNLINALDNLLNNQNNLILNWVQFEVLRRQLDLNMGTMQLDERGQWIDPGEITLETIREFQSGDFVPGMNLKTDGDSAPDSNLPPMGRNPIRNTPGASQFSDAAAGLQSPNRQVSGAIQGTGLNAQPVRTAEFQRGSQSKGSFNLSGSQSLYSNFDSDLKRARTGSLDTSVRRPKSEPFQGLPKGETVEKREQVEEIRTAENQTPIVNSSEYRESMKNSLKVNPFPFQIRRK